MVIGGEEVLREIVPSEDPAASTEPPMVIGGEEGDPNVQRDRCRASTEPPMVIGGEPAQQARGVGAAAALQRSRRW